MTEQGDRWLERFIVGVVSRLGLLIDEHNQEQVADVLQQRLERTGLRSADEYITRFQNGDRFASDELRAVAKELTVPETFFFRHAEQFQALQEVALPARLKARGDTLELNILSAGCASGEESYSIAAIVSDFPGIQNWNVRIWGVDINAHLLQKARSARYSAWSLRAVQESEGQRYFQRDGDDYVLDARLKSMVIFEERNLVAEDPCFWRRGFFDVVFCRNVTIYFEPDATKSLIARLACSLVPGGFLFLGPSETLRGISQEFHLRHTHGAFYYQRLLSDQTSRREPSPFESKNVMPPVPPPPLVEEIEWSSVIEAANKRIGRVGTRPPTEQPEGRRRTKQAATSSRPEDGNRLLREVSEMVQHERFHEALRAIRTCPQGAPEDPDLMLLEAVGLTNTGEISRAEEVCHRLLQIDELRPGAHYLIAVCQERRGDLLLAAEHDHLAIYLDPSFAMPRLHLGLVAKRLGDLATARRALREALALLPREDGSRILLFGGGFTREALMRFCQAQFDRCGGSR